MKARQLKKSSPVKTILKIAPRESLHEMAFDHAAQATIIFSVKTGKIVVANLSACRLLGYSSEEILSKKRPDIFLVKEPSFKKMMARRKSAGKATANVNAVMKNGGIVPCEVSSAAFNDHDGNVTSITTITDRRTAIATQKKKDIKKKNAADDSIECERQRADTILSQTNQWLKCFAETSYDVMWDWDIATGEIYVGNSIEEVFGYSIKADTLSYKRFITYLLPAERKRFELNIEKQLAGRKKMWQGAFLLRREDGIMASTTSRACIIRDVAGKAIRMVGATQDVSKLLELEQDLSEKEILHEKDREKFRLMSKLSFDVIWDWNLATKELFIGEGFKELFGYTIKKNKGNMLTDWVDHIHPDDKDLISLELGNSIKSKTGQWKRSYRIIRADGSLAKVYVRASIMRDAAGRAYRMIGAVQDLTRQKELESLLDVEIQNNSHLLATYRQNFKLIFNSSSTIFYDVDLAANTVVMSEAFEKEFGHKLTGNTISGNEWMSHVHADDREALLRDFGRVLKEKRFEWNYNFRYLRSNGSAVDITGNSIVLRHADGVAYRVIGSMQDHEKQVQPGKMLAAEIESKEKDMAYAVEEARMAERSDIGKELHDNVNQLLGASKLYIEMARQGGKDSAMFLSRSTEYTMTAIEEIRKLTKGMTTDTINLLRLVGSIEKIAADTMEVQPLSVILTIDHSIEETINEKVKLNILRIVQEQFNNITKYAGASVVTLSLTLEGNSILLIINDNGKGFDVAEVSKGIGLNNIAERVKLINATSCITSEIGKGTTFTLRLNLK